MDDIDSHAETKTVTLSGELTIYTAADNMARLKEAFAGEGDIRIALKDTTAVDVSGIQLLCSAHRTAAVSGRGLTLAKPLPDLFREVSAKAGFKRRAGCSFDPKATCLYWDGER